MNDAELIAVFRRNGYTVQRCLASGFVRENPFLPFPFELTNEGRARAMQIARPPGRWYQNADGEWINADVRQEPP